jgi:protein-disulfide isomerase
VSDKNRRRTARERLAVEREKQKAAEKRRRALIVGAAVVCVLGLAAVIGVVAANAGKDTSDAAGPAVAPSGATGKNSLAIPVGKENAPSTLTVWEDFRCPACKAFETTYRSTIQELTDSGKLRREYHLATLIDDNTGGTGSHRAANAAACAQDAGKFPAYHDVLYDNQPPETEDGFRSNDRLIQLAGKVDGLDTPAFRRCVTDGTHDAWVTKSSEAFKNGGFSGTPTVLLNGKNVYQDQSMTPQKLRQMVEQAAKS